MEKIKLVKVTNEKLARLVESLASSIWQEYYVPIIGRQQTEYMLDKFQSRTAVLNQIAKEGYLYYLLNDKDNNWIGYIGIVLREKELFLSKFYINTKDRGKGYGKYALTCIERIAKDKKLTKISLTVNKNNTPSIKIYEKLGFIISGWLVTDIGNGFVMDDYRMEKAVASP
ncbi:MAG TPA: GNAT family N-acetyltransferase [Candidatus Omnitrophota bacterium]|nr:GNAT family N-acetyltransferase [Candidatus Omnitrophota bacterium]HPT39588.1 GNAT family N-acetyltransferase [Candidatus Omnitrophota bacterium]